MSPSSKNKAAPWISFVAGIGVVIVGALAYRSWKTHQPQDLAATLTSNMTSTDEVESAPEQSIPMTKAELSGTAREALVSCLGTAYLSVTNIDEAFQILKRQPGGLQNLKTEWENIYFVAEDGSERRARFDANDPELQLDQIESGGMPVPIDLPETERSVPAAELLERYRKNHKIKHVERSSSAELAFNNGSRALVSWRESDEGATELKFEAPDRELRCEPDPEQGFLQLCGCEKKGESSDVDADPDPAHPVDNEHPSQ